MTELGSTRDDADIETLECLECGESFEFGPDERRFYAEHGSKRPECCLDCRERRRSQRNAKLLNHYEQSLGASDWQEHLGHFGGRTGAVGQRDGGKRGGYQAICSRCGKTAIVPFVPRNGRPVYCKNCFSDRKSQRTRKSQKQGKAQAARG